jgi:toxin ParE1/3/4
MSDSYSVIYSPEAIDDLREIYAYIAFDLLVPETAKNQANRIRERIHSLNFMPSRHSHVDWEPWKSMGIRKVPVDNFVVYYSVNDNSYTVTVIRIFYGGRNAENIVNATPPFPQN